MKQTDDFGRLKHMLYHALEARDMVIGKQRSDLDTDRKLNLALVRLLEIVGEAAARVSDEGRKSLPQIPWPGIVGLRNRLIHGYDEVDFDILWDILDLDLPPLITQLQSALRDASSDRRSAE
jgi:uncharacterized protein with HEPN domain